MELTRVLAFRFPLVRGEDVRTVQMALVGLKVEPSCGDPDGIYGDQTRLSVLAFQKSHNVARGAGQAALEEDGTVGPKTWGVLIPRAADRGVAAAAVKAASQAIASTPARPASPPAMTGGTIQPIVGTRKAPLPSSEMLQTRLVKGWLMQHFGSEIGQAVSGTPFDPDLVCAIGARETGIKWLPWINALTPAELLARCVFDASGDYPGTSRRAFPVNAAAFRTRYGDAIGDDLIAEANLTRALQGWGPEKWLYKGYGIFQYDLQHFEKDEAWFREKQWQTIGGCLSRLLRELNDKHAAAGGSDILRDTVRRYNGSGTAAEEYATNVMQRYAWCRQ